MKHFLDALNSGYKEEDMVRQVSSFQDFFVDFDEQKKLNRKLKKREKKNGIQRQRQNKTKTQGRNQVKSKQRNMDVQKETK